jgi:hypothetical protein
MRAISKFGLVLAAAGTISAAVELGGTLSAPPFCTGTSFPIELDVAGYAFFVGVAATLVGSALMLRGRGPKWRGLDFSVIAVSLGAINLAALIGVLVFAWHHIDTTYGCP